jgi:transposase-like protein
MSCVLKSYPVLSSCPETNEKKRCPKCGSLHTKKKGFTHKTLKTSRGIIPHKLQRYYCHACTISFTSQGCQERRYPSKKQQQEAVLDYVAATSTLREVSYRYHVSHQTIINWMMRYSSEIKAELPQPKTWSGYISFDAKETSVSGKKRILLFALDSYTGYPFDYHISIQENTEATQTLLEKVGSVKIQIRLLL